MTTLLIGLIASALTLAPSADAGPGKDPPPAEAELEAVRASASVDIDGRLDDSAWEEAEVVGDFWELMPREGVPAVRPTEVRVLYDATHLYVAFRAHDDSAAVRATRGRRDQVFEDDLVMVSIDPRGTSEWAYAFGANPYGVQVDMRDSGMSQDSKLDLIYESAGRITGEGYVVEMAIPFSSVGGAPGEEAWRVNFLRIHPRATRHVSSWMPVTREDPCTLCQHGRLAGFSDVERRTAWSVLPTLTASQTSRRPEVGQALSHGSARPEGSLTAGVRTPGGWSFDGTYNPDFSQVESDAAQVDVNSTLALSYPEKRPFFQEGSELWETPMDVVYTRSMNDPDGAWKARGEVGGWQVGYLGARDEISPLFVPLNERTLTTRAGESTSHLVRAKRSLGSGSFAGVLLTDRAYDNGARGTTLGVDGVQRLGEGYTLTYQLLGSSVTEAEDGVLRSSGAGFSFRGEDYTARHDGERFMGYGAHLALTRRDRRSHLQVRWEAASPTLQAANGFLRRNDYHDLEISGGLSFQPERGIVDDVSPRLEVGREWTFDGRLQRTYVEPMYQMMLTGQTIFALAHSHADESFAGRRFRGLDKTTVAAQSRALEEVGLLAQVRWGDEIARMLDEPEVGRELTVFARFTLKPTAALSVEPQYTYSRLVRPTTGQELYSGWISRVKASYQVSREISVRLTTQYNSFRDQLEVDPLITYQISPYTLFYVGATHELVGAEGTQAAWSLSERQIFLKLQYRFGG